MKGEVSVLTKKIIFGGGLRLMRQTVGPTTRHVFYALIARNSGMNEYVSHYSGVTVFLRLS